MVDLGNKEEVYEVGYNDISAFAHMFLPKAMYAKTPQFHKEIYADLKNSSLKKIAIIAPRGHSKSTVASVVYPLWRICYNPPTEDYFCIIISESQSQSINFLSIIAENLRSNHLLRAYFGNLLGDKWTEEEIRTVNNCRIMAKGTGQKIRGMLMGKATITRPNDVILDDFESETNSGTREQIEKNISWVAKAVEPSLADDGRLITIGTIIHEASYLSRTRGDPAFKTHFYQAIMNNVSLWPQRFSLNKLAKLKTSYEARGILSAFYQEYMNIPISLEDQCFREEWYRYFIDEFCVKSHQPLLVRDNVLIPIGVGIGVDLAISEDKRADFSVVAAVGTDFDENKYLLEYDRMKTKNINDIIESMIRMSIKYQANTINIETVQFQQAVANEFRRIQFQRECYVGVVESKPRTSKDSRIRSLQPLFASGRFHHRREMTEFESELFSFPNAAHDDILDGVYLANEVSHAPEIERFVESLNRAERNHQEVESWYVL